MDQALFVQAILQLAEKHGVKADIDFETNTVNFDGEPEDETALALELDELFGSFVG